MNPVIVLTAMSNAISSGRLDLIMKLRRLLEREGFPAACGRTLTPDPRGLPRTDLKVQEMTELRRNPDLRFIMDVSGGDTANELLAGACDLMPGAPLPDSVLPGKDVIFMGYSDLTALLNAFYAIGGRRGALFSGMNVLGDTTGNRLRELLDFLKSPSSRSPLVTPRGGFRRGKKMQGTVIGGNIRCFLKLAGTQYMPEPDGKVLALEGLNGNPERLISYFAALKTLGITARVSGIVLGTFTELKTKYPDTDPLDLLLPFIPRDLPVWETPEIGHHREARGIMIGAEYVFTENGCFGTGN